MYNNLEQALSERSKARGGYSFLGKKEIRNVIAAIPSDETFCGVAVWGMCSTDSTLAGNVIAVLTDKQLHLLVPTLFGGLTHELIQLTKNTVVAKEAIIFNSYNVVIKSPGVSVNFGPILGDFADSFISECSKSVLAKSDLRTTGNPQKASAGEVAITLQTLKELVDSGLITESDFEQKKLDLLKRL